MPSKNDSKLFDFVMNLHILYLMLILVIKNIDMKELDLKVGSHNESFLVFGPLIVTLKWPQMSFKHFNFSFPNRLFVLADRG